MINLLAKAMQMGASDLHLTSGTPPFVRVNGEIILMDEPPLTPAKSKEIVYAIMDEGQRQEFEREWQICFSRTVPDLGYFRITVYYQRGSVEAAVRIGMTRIKTLPELGLPPLLAELSRKPNGLILVTGPTGQGKTTTLNAIIDMINRERRSKIITVEDPIEYIHDNNRSIVVQQEVHTDTKSFNRALVHILRQDPDVIGVGEMRDLETITAALTGAETGHLVIATLHSNDCPQTVNRIVDVFPENQQHQVRYQLALTLRAILNLRLLPRADKSGRVLAYSLLIANQAIQNLIRENKLNQIVSAMLTGKQEGMVLMDDLIKEFYEKAIISYDTAITNVTDPKRLHKRS